MRVVSGKVRGTKLISVPGDSTRPILDRVKTSLFDILRSDLKDKTFLDLFAGSGAVGIEALSQAAAHCTFIDLEPKAVSTIKKNLENTKFTEQATVWNKDAFAFLKSFKSGFDLIYIAPPQFKSIWTQAMHAIAERPHLVNQLGKIIVQIHPKEYEKLALNSFEEYAERKYGNTLLVFYKKLVT